MGQDFKYQAFISYAHTDEAAARRIHNALETYPIPKDMDEALRRKLTPIFRDVTELTAHHSLSEKIQEAVKSSRYLIVLCSPAAKISHWVNEEIKLFRRLHGESAILSVIVDGNPETAFPPALTKDGREPLAANMTTREGFRFGTTQLAASMLGVGLDRLVQRDSKRRRKRMQLITAGALVFAGLMGGMTWTAMDARDEAEVSRTEAEKMVEYLITDLKDELEPVGRLSILDDVGTRVASYYNAIPLSDMDDDRLARHARARHLLGQVALNQRDMDKAKTEIEASYEATQEVLRRNPDDTDAIFAHAQSAFWIGDLYFTDKDVEKMGPPWIEYNDLAEKLYTLDPTNFDWVMEAAYGQSNLGLWAREFYSKPEMQKAIEHYSGAILLYKEALEINPKSKLAQPSLADALSGRATAELAFGSAHASRKFKLEELKYLNQLIQEYPDNKKLLIQKLISELDYYHDFFLTLTEIQEKDIKIILSKLYDLTLYDPENARLKFWFLDYSFEYLSKVENQPSRDLITMLSSIIPQLSDKLDNKDYYDVMLALVESRPVDRSKISEILMDANVLESKKSRLLELNFLQNKNSDNAESFLLALETNSTLPFPTLLDKKIRAHLVLNNCSQMNSFSDDLQSRGFYRISKPSTSTC